LAGGRVIDIEAAAASHPLAIDQGVCFQQGWVFEEGEWGGGHMSAWYLKEIGRINRMD
jgi:hypothetical protein